MGYTTFDQIWCKHWYKCHKTLESRDLLKTRSSLIIRVTWLTEDALVVDVLDDEPGSSGEDGDEDVEVEEERDPGGRLVLRHRRDDRDVDLGVAGVPQRVEPSAPRGYVACKTLTRELWGALHSKSREMWCILQVNQDSRQLDCAVPHS